MIDGAIREILIEARTSLRVGAYDTALAIIDDLIREKLPRTDDATLGTLDPAFRALIDGEISVGRMREIMRLWLAGRPFDLPAKREPTFPWEKHGNHSD